MIDLTDPERNPDIYKNAEFDLIIADVPCTGSGTWSRTPEQLYFFEERKTSEYAVLQKKIMTTVIPKLKPGGHLLYVTCSVFKKENEEMIRYIQDSFKLELVSLELMKGYDKKADTMFAALLKTST
jgi:16S rRNA (cytosine967-C5)-methyltransferase